MVLGVGALRKLRTLRIGSGGTGYSCLHCCQFGDFVDKFSYFLIVAATFIAFLRQGAILDIFK